MDENTIAVIGAMVTMVTAFSAFALKLQKDFLEFLAEEREQRKTIMNNSTNALHRLATEVKTLNERIERMGY